jgi:hypothetical protein
LATAIKMKGPLMKKEYLDICSECFSDFGLRQIAKTVGIDNIDRCPRCDVTFGRKFTKTVISQLCEQFFVEGSKMNGKGIFAPLVQVNTSKSDPDKFGTRELNSDIQLLYSIGIRCFQYGPPLWMFGKPADDTGFVSWSDQDYEFIINNCDEFHIANEQVIFRVRTNVPDHQFEAKYFCAPPLSMKKSHRFNGEDQQMFYGAFDVETCIHECRVTLADEIFVASLKPRPNLKILDLRSCRCPHDTDRFSDPSIWLSSLIFNGESSYKTCRALAERILTRGYDGFVYKSYFQQATNRKHTNIAIFGAPIEKGVLTCHSINIIRIKDISYDWQFGPAVIGNDHMSTKSEDSSSSEPFTSGP